MKTRKMFLFTIAIFLFISYYLLLQNHAIALSKYGSRGDEVTQIQTKLKRWGYYTGSVDGVYGTQTQEAVKYFQRKNGLTVDGIAGTKTLQAMGIMTSSSSNNTSSNTSSNDLNLLSKLIHAEARGEPYSRTSSGRSSGIKPSKE